MRWVACSALSAIASSSRVTRAVPGAAEGRDVQGGDFLLGAAERVLDRFGVDLELAQRRGSRDRACAAAAVRDAAPSVRAAPSARRRSPAAAAADMPSPSAAAGVPTGPICSMRKTLRRTGMRLLPGLHLMRAFRLTSGSSARALRSRNRDQRLTMTRRILLKRNHKMKNDRILTAVVKILARVFTKPMLVVDLLWRVQDGIRPRCCVHGQSIPMQRIVVPCLASTLLTFSAFAAPLDLPPDPAARRRDLLDLRRRATAGAPVRVAQGPTMGGGFIEMLFRAPGAASAQRAEHHYQPAPSATQPEPMPGPRYHRPRPQAEDGPDFMQPPRASLQPDRPRRRTRASRGRR